MNRFRGLASILALGALIALPGVASAQANYPEKDIHVICGYAPGSGADIITRYFAERLSKASGRTVIVDNKDGALTTIGASTFKSAKPDGYTLMITAGNSTLSSAPHLFKQLNYDPKTDFEPIHGLIKLPFMVGVDPSSPIKTLAELTAALKAKGDKATYGYSSAFAQVSTELYQSLAGTKAIGVSYKSTPTIMPDLAAGQLDFIFSDATFLLAQAEQNRFRPLAVTFAEGTSIAPNIPGMKAAGLAGYDLGAWWLAMAPKGTPAAVVKKLEGYFAQIVADPQTKTDMVRFGAEPYPANGQTLKAMIPGDIDNWGKYAKLAKIQPQ
jgi:tripartite-type tricarboxylate transporter receptor subunit TctC